MSKFQTSLENGPHKLLAGLEGTWEGTNRTWFEPDVIADESPISGTIRLVLDGRFAVHEYKSSFQGKPSSGMTIYGYDLQKQRWQSILIDSFHMSTGIMFQEGNSDPAINVLGSYDGSEPDGPKWGWRTEINIGDTGNLTITSYNIEPSQAEQKAVEISYHRV